MTDLLERLLRGDVRALARVISKVENRTPDSTELLQALYPKSGRARVVGVTGSPGAGKSTLVDKLAVAYRQAGHTLAVVAVDPSSSFTGGAILGDRIRMQTQGVDDGIYIRSMATRGNLGGLAAATADVATVLDAAGRDPVIVETVGVGQDEIDIVKLADVSIVVLVPGMGDDVQALKAGIMEIGDIFVINKCDRPGVDKMEKTLRAMLSLAHRPDGWEPRIVRTTASTGEGTEALVKAIEESAAFLDSASAVQDRRTEAARQHLIDLLEERLVPRALEQIFDRDTLDRLVQEISDRRRDPYSVVARILEHSRFERFPL